MSTNSKQQMCAFTKHRNVIQFENFYDNHPATYLPFVFFNHMLISVLPSLYAEESTAVENSRIVLLQEQKIGLKILEILINTNLNIKIKLNEETFEKNVGILKTSSPITREMVYPLLVPENYMTETDSITYRTALSSFFPERVVTKSEDLIPCTRFYEEMPHSLEGTRLWGPSMWHVLHYATFVIDQQEESKESKEYLAILSGVFDLFLPCGICRYHYRSASQQPEEKYSRPFHLTLPYLALDYAKAKNMFEFYSELHNYCKPLTDTKELLSVEYYKRLYKSFYDKSYLPLEIDSKI